MQDKLDVELVSSFYNRDILDIARLLKLGANPDRFIIPLSDKKKVKNILDKRIGDYDEPLIREFLDLGYTNLVDTLVDWDNSEKVVALKLLSHYSFKLKEEIYKQLKGTNSSIIPTK